MNVPCGIQAHYRDPALAHRWSTSYSILSGKILLDELRCLPNGCDLDGNLWFKQEWAKGGSDQDLANEFPFIVANANKLGPKKSVYAEEGYDAEDPRRNPNLKAIPISKHITGHAIDLNVDWGRLGGPLSEEANTLIARFGLCRPVSSEVWHVELNVSQGMQVSPGELLVAFSQHIFRRVKGLR